MYHSHSSWGPALGGAAIVNVCTLIGVAILAIPKLTRDSEGKRMTTLASGFAAGTLLASAFYLLLPEALLSISEGMMMAHKDHRRLEEEEEKPIDLIPIAVVWRWATLILAGFCVVFTLDVVFDVAKSKLLRFGRRAPATAAGEDPAVKTVDKLEVGNSPEDAVTDVALAPRLLFAILVGDAMHNFVDGIFIGTAFLSCAPAVGWAVVTSTIAHEVTSEIADFMLLTTTCGLRIWQALACNFASGVTIYFGVIAVLASDLSPTTAGMLLAAGGGLYLYNAAVECLPRVLSTEVVLRDKMQAFALFAAGVVAIGLVLMDHEHCEAH